MSCAVGFASNQNSCQPCGCDPGCDGGYLCERHRAGETSSLKAYHIPSQVTDAATLQPCQASVPTVLSSEIRVVDPLTGGEKGSKTERFDLIPEEMETA